MILIMMITILIGEYVAPEKIENINGQSKYIGQSFVRGLAGNYLIIITILLLPHYHN